MSVTVVEGERDTDRCVGHRAGGGFWCDLPFVRVVRSLRGGVFPAALEPVALAVHFQDVDVVGETVQQCAPVSLSDPNTSVHSSKGRLVVTRIEPRS